jgi:hypothetical protein
MQTPYAGRVSIRRAREGGVRTEVRPNGGRGETHGLRTGDRCPVVPEAARTVSTEGGASASPGVHCRHEVVLACELPADRHAHG